MKIDRVINSLDTVSNDIKSNHEGALFVSTKYLLNDSSTLEVIYRDIEENKGVELELRHNKNTECKTKKVCKNCKFWDDSSHLGVGICNGIEIHDPGFGWNQDPKILFDIEVKVCDDSGLQYDLKTGPEFGCVRFSNKNSED